MVNKFLRHTYFLIIVLLASCNSSPKNIYDSIPKSGIYNETSINFWLNDSFQHSINGSKPYGSFQNSFKSENEKFSSFYKIPTGPIKGKDQLGMFKWKENIELPYRAIALRVDSNQFYTYFTKTHQHKAFPFKLPVISLFADPDDLFSDEKGIYVPGKHYNIDKWYGWWPPGNYTQKWKKQGHIHYFNEKGELKYESNITFTVMGFGVSGFPQKSLKIKFKDKNWITNRCSYPILKSLNYQPSRIILRNSGQDFVSTHFRDAFAQSLLDGLSVEHQTCEPVVLLINGEYWGIMNLKERFDKSYFKHKYGYHNIDILENEKDIKGGDFNSFNKLMEFIKTHDLSIPSNYDTVVNQIDMENYMTYLCFQLYTGNYDWPGVNQLFWMRRDTIDQWKWMMVDCDYTFGFDKMGITNRTASYNYIKDATDPNGPNWPNPAWSTLLNRKLFSNATFRKTFEEVSDQLLNTAFSEEVVLKKLYEFEELYRPEMKRHIQRWKYPNSLQEWEKEIEKIKKYIKTRKQYYNKQLEEYYDSFSN